MFELKRTQTAYERVIDHVHENIISGAYRVGSKLPPVDYLAEILDVPTSTVSDALKTLGILGITINRPNGTCYISNELQSSLLSTLSMIFVLENLDYIQITQFREALEFKALELAIKNSTDSYMKKLSSLIYGMRESTSEEHAADFDMKFHASISLMSQNKFIINLLESISILTGQLIHNVRGQLILKKDPNFKLQKAHEQILMGIGEKNYEKAAAGLKIHFDIVDAALAEQNAAN